MIKAE
jgi:hypothetical protein